MHPAPAALRRPDLEVQKRGSRTNSCVLADETCNEAIDGVLLGQTHILPLAEGFENLTRRKTKGSQVGGINLRVAGEGAEEGVNERTVEPVAQPHCQVAGEPSTLGV